MATAILNVGVTAASSDSGSLNNLMDVPTPLSLLVYVTVSPAVRGRSAAQYGYCMAVRYQITY